MIKENKDKTTLKKGSTSKKETTRETTRIKDGKIAKFKPFWATKYTKEFVHKEMDELLDQVQSDKSIKYFWSLFENRGYPAQRVSGWIKQYPKDQELASKLYTIKEIIKARVVDWALDGTYNPTFTIFYLKNNYWWKDKTEVETTNKNLNADLKDLTDDQLNKYLEE